MHPITECIVLAGGKGTRLQSVVQDKPKCLAEIAGKPFLHYLLQYLQMQEIERVVFSLGYLHEQVQAWVSNNISLYNLHHEFAVEADALGTGGAVKFALSYCDTDNVLIVNGDTMFDVDVHALGEFHHQSQADLTIALKPMFNFDRYGTVQIDELYEITEFTEKQAQQEGLINGGVYCITRAALLTLELPQKFGFEQDYLMKAKFHGHKLCGLVQDSYFIDIGIPEDFEKANAEFPQLFA
jgi:D-glycero-alpha-D-manno-heptose 1-phosphate guanylyltransferase